MTGIYHYDQESTSIFVSFCPIHLIQLHNIETLPVLPNTVLPRLRTVCAEGDLPKKSTNEGRKNYLAVGRRRGLLDGSGCG